MIYLLATKLIKQSKEIKTYPRVKDKKSKTTAARWFSAAMINRARSGTLRRMVEHSALFD
ncbi:MAG: hypothetical protein H0X72_00825 [Acidobacteria bacterium]|jgi:hypothetical protein|nr:hypothetical protein [Acidobacteriota bacterium]